MTAIYRMPSPGRTYRSLDTLLAAVRGCRACEHDLRWERARYCALMQRPASWSSDRRPASVRCPTLRRAISHGSSGIPGSHSSSCPRCKCASGRWLRAERSGLCQATPALAASPMQRRRDQGHASPLPSSRRPSPVPVCSPSEDGNDFTRYKANRSRRSRMSSIPSKLGFLG